MSQLDAKLQAEVEALLRLAETADASERPEGMDIPQEPARREQRLACIAQAKAQIEAAAAQAYEQAQARFEAKQAERERRKNEGRRPPGPPPTPPSPAVDPKAQVNLTDADSRIMKISHFITACRLRRAQERRPMHSHRPWITPSPTGC